MPIQWNAHDLYGLHVYEKEKYQKLYVVKAAKREILKFGPL